MRKLFTFHSWLSWQCGMRLATVACLCTGLFFRILPLFNVNERLYRYFITEDAYLSLAIARNIARGLGPVVKVPGPEQFLLTNGFQPLMVFISAGFFWITNINSALTLLLVQAFSVFVALLTWQIMRKVFEQFLADYPARTDAAALISGMWFASAQPLNESMTGLETGLYVLMVLLCLQTYIRLNERHKDVWSMKSAAQMGALLGLTFWTRVDAVFLIAATCAMRLLQNFFIEGLSLKQRLQDPILCGVVASLIAAPWLAYGIYIFGTPEPISGIAQSHYGHFGDNIGYLPQIILSQFFPFAGIGEDIPGPWIPEELAFKDQWTVFILSIVAVASSFERVRRTQRPALGIIVLFGFCLYTFYGLFFSARHFLYRYVLPFAPFLLLLGICVVLILGNMLLSVKKRSWVFAACFMWISYRTIVMNSERYNFRGGRANFHFGTVDWVAEHLSEHQWIGAMQSGTLGFFHENTVNLDGKVNPHAMRAHLDMQFFEYMRDVPIEYYIDWPMSIEWVNPRVFEIFEKIYENNDEWVVVLKRKNP